MTNRGDWITLGVLGALAAGAAARGRRGGRNFTDQEQIEEERRFWGVLFPTEEGIQDLNEIQKKGLLRDQILLPDGRKPDQVLVYDLSYIQAYSARAEALRAPTLRGERAYQPKLWLSDKRGLSNTSLYSALLALWDERDEEYSFFLLPGSPILSPTPVLWEHTR